MPSSIPEEAVRKFLELRWPNWKIARELKTSPTTVQRVRTKIQTGPNPVLLDDTQEDEGRPARQALSPSVLLAIALIALSLIAAGVIWGRIVSHPAAPAPQYTLCVQLAPALGLANGNDGTCPPRWTAVILTPGR